MALEIIGKDTPLSWEEFESIVQSDIQSAKQARGPANNKAAHSDWIFRGQSNAEWELLTSLERYLKYELGDFSTSYSLKKYYVRLASIVPTVNALLNRNFPRIAYKALSKEKMEPAPYYELLCFTRHLGFPSPLLDWSASYFIAAFFAFKHANENQNVAIYSYKEWNGEARGGWIGDPIIDQQGPYVETHARHYKQQSTYTLCKADINDEVVFMQHETAVERNPIAHNIKKFILDGNQKEAIMEKLFMMNINDYTVFGDEESLMRMLTYKSFKCV